MQNSARVLAVLIAVLMSSCVLEESVYDPRPQPIGHGFKIPPADMPPQGQCRIWFPDLPPGEQSPPGDCHELQQHIPPGAVLVRARDR
jgi:hypothetical protein